MYYVKCLESRYLIIECPNTIICYIRNIQNLMYSYLTWYVIYCYYYLLKHGCEEWHLKLFFKQIHLS